MERVIVGIAIIVTVMILGEVQGHVDLVCIWTRRADYLHDFAVQDNWRDRAGFIGAAIAGVEIAGIGPRKEPLVGGYRIARLVSAICDRSNSVDRGAAPLQRDGLGRAAIVLQSQRIEQRIGAVRARSRGEATTGVVGDVVADVGVRSVTVATRVVRKNRAFDRRERKHIDSTDIFSVSRDSAVGN